MHKRTTFFLGLLLALVVAGCGTFTITNLTPSTLPRNSTGQYLVEMALDTTQQTIRPESVTPVAVVGFNEYKMRLTLKMTNRWETYIPMPAGMDTVPYHFKVNFQFNRFGKPGEANVLSPEYKLTIAK